MGEIREPLLFHRTGMTSIVCVVPRGSKAHLSEVAVLIYHEAQKNRNFAIRIPPLRRKTSLAA
jgi:hypothetical protein